MWFVATGTVAYFDRDLVREEQLRVSTSTPRIALDNHRLPNI